MYPRGHQTYLDIKYIYSGTTTSPYIEKNVWPSEEGAVINNNNAGGQSPSRDTKNQEQPIAIHINTSHSNVHGEAMKNGDRSPTTSSASDLHVQQQEQITNNMASISISPSSPVRNAGNIDLIISCC